MPSPSEQSASCVQDAMNRLTNAAGFVGHLRYEGADDDVLIVLDEVDWLTSENAEMRDLIGEVWSILITRGDPFRALDVLNNRAPAVAPPTVVNGPSEVQP